jgi:hypothetical protein
MIGSIVAVARSGTHSFSKDTQAAITLRTPLAVV